MKSIKSKLVKQLMLLVMILAVFVTISAPLVSQATDDNVPFSFTVSINGKPSHFSKSRFRQTTNVRNSWKVQMDSSTEVKNVRSVTKFYLGVQNKPYNAQGSAMYNVILRDAASYFPAYSNASAKNVYLYARDDTTTNKNYDVVGYWDEETGVIR